MNNSGFVRQKIKAACMIMSTGLTSLLVSGNVQIRIRWKSPDTQHVTLIFVRYDPKALPQRTGPIMNHYHLAILFRERVFALLCGNPRWKTEIGWFYFRCQFFLLSVPTYLPRNTSWFFWSYFSGSNARRKKEGKQIHVKQKNREAKRKSTSDPESLLQHTK